MKELKHELFLTAEALRIMCDFRVAIDFGCISVDRRRVGKAEVTRAPKSLILRENLNLLRSRRVEVERGG